MEQQAHITSNLRAKQIHKGKYKQQREDVDSTKRELFNVLYKIHGDDYKELKDKSMGSLWRKFVKNRNDAEAFMEVMYPQFAKPIQLAYVHMFERAIRGEIQLDEAMIFKKGEVSQKWNPIDDLEQEKTEGLINLTGKRLEELIKDENNVNK